MYIVQKETDEHLTIKSFFAKSTNERKRPTCFLFANGTEIDSQYILDSVKEEKVMLYQNLSLDNADMGSLMDLYPQSSMSILEKDLSLSNNNSYQNNNYLLSQNQDLD